MSDTAKLANFGRDVAKRFGAFKTAEAKLCEEIHALLDAGEKPIKITHDIFGRCNSNAERRNLMSVLFAMVELKKIPEEIVTPLRQGIRPKRL